MIFKNCLHCQKEFRTFPSNLKRGFGRYCSRVCGKFGNKNSLGYRHSEASCQLRRTVALSLNSAKHLPRMYGADNPSWKPNRDLKTSDRRADDVKYKVWSRDVKNRDGWECRITNEDCFGRMESHHILPWRDYPELRYDLNNGITLCHQHHPRKATDEARLASVFQSLVSTIL